MAAISVQEGGGGDYTSLEAAVENASTVDGDVITISGTWTAREDTRITVADALTIRATGDSKHPGRPWTTGDTHYQHRSTSNTSGNHSFTITDTGTIVFDGLDIQHAGTGVSNEVFRNNVSNTLEVKNCVIGFDSRTDQQDIYYNEAQIDVTFENCMFYNAYRAVVDAQNYDAGSVVNINSCSGYDIGFSATSTSRSGLVGRNNDSNTFTLNIFNTICEINTGALVSNPAGTNLTSNLHTVITNSATLVQNDTLNTDTNNVTSATITDSTASTAYIFEDTTTSPYDLRLTDNANNTAQDNHTNGTGTGTGLSVPSTDIIGTSRPQNTNYDIGAFEIEGGAFTLTANSGAYTITGAAAALEFGANVAADSGSYTYTGTAAVLNFGFNLSADSGSYTYSGTDVTLTFESPSNFTLTADTGAYTYSGTNAALEASFSIAANSGTYTYAGTNADLNRGFNLAADSGAYSYTGANASLLLDSVLNANAGGYVYNGTDVILDFSGQVWTIQADANTAWASQSDASTAWAIQSDSSTSWTIQ